MKKPISVRTLRDLHALDRYSEKLDPAKQSLKEVVGTTSFAELVQCGLTSCRTWHLHGLLVETEDAWITNIGNICGSHFGAALFARKLSDYQERVLRPHLLQKIGAGRWEIHSQMRPLDSQVAQLRELLGWRRRFKSTFPQLSMALMRRSNEGLSKVSEVVERTESEIEEARTLSPSTPRERLRYREVEIGRLIALEFLTGDAIDLLSLSQKANELMDIESLNPLSLDQLLDWERWLDALPDRMLAGARMIEAGNRFFSQMNTALFPRLVTDPSERSRISVQAVNFLAVERSIAVAANDDSLKCADHRGRRKGWRR